MEPLTGRKGCVEMGLVLENPFANTLGASDLIAAAAPAVVAGQWNELGRYTVSAGMAVALGFGGMEGQDSAAGRIYMDLRDNAVAPGAAINGRIRFTLDNPQKRTERVLFEARTERLRTTAADPTKQIPFSFIDAVATEDWSLVLEYMPDAAQTVGRANCVILVDVTTFDARRG